MMPGIALKQSNLSPATIIRPSFFELSGRLTFPEKEKMKTKLRQSLMQYFLHRFHACGSYTSCQLHQYNAFTKVLISEGEQMIASRVSPVSKQMVGNHLNSSWELSP